MNNQPVIARQDWPKEIIVEPWRLAMGIWGQKEGDIHAAYSADIFPKLRTFVHEGHRFTNCGGLCEEAMNCYPLIPEPVYQGPEPAEFTYEGRSAIWGGQKVRLGPCVKFIVRERTLEEWTHLLRRQYAHGGMFAAGKSYCEMLQEFLQSDGKSDGERSAIQNELAQSDPPQTQSQMLERLSAEPDAAFPAKADDISQLSFPGL